MFTRCSLDEGGTQLSACGIADDYHSVVTFIVGLDDHCHSTATEFTLHKPKGDAPRPPHIRQVGGGCTSRQVMTLVPRVYLFVLARRTHAI